MITHHPEPESLMSCSAGSMPEAFAAVMSSHITVCPQCRKDLAILEDIGTALFDKLPAAPVSRDAPVLAMRTAEAGTESAPIAATRGDVPAPLAPVIGHYLDAVPWKRVAPGVWQHAIPVSNTTRGTLRLIKLAPGLALPEHCHNGSELTLILRGSYSDETGVYKVGDVADVSGDTRHSPVADAVEGCICLAANDGKMKFKSLVAKLFQPFTGF